MGDHSKECTFNPAVQHRRWQEEANEAAKAKAEERRRQQDYKRQGEAQEAETIAARRQGEVDTGPPTHDTCNCHPENWCTCGAPRTTTYRTHILGDTNVHTLGISPLAQTIEVILLCTPTVPALQQPLTRGFLP